MKSDDGSCHQHQLLKSKSELIQQKRHRASPYSMLMPSMSTPSCSLSTNGSSTQSSLCSTLNRRKTSLSYEHQLQQAAECVDAANDVSVSQSAIYGTASPSRFNAHPSEGFHPIGGRLSLHPVDRYDDTMTCCLPPPSPAPTSDRLMMMGLPSPSPSALTTSSSSHHFSDKQYQQAPHLPTSCAGGQPKYGSHRTMSPNSRFRISDRFRELSPKCDRFVSNNSHFLANSTPLVSSDGYTYLSSMVHTPVKRYVPTPPPPTEIYSDNPQSSSSTSSSSGYHTIGNSPHLPHQQQSQTQSQLPTHVSTLPFRFRMKCCLTDQPAAAAASAAAEAHMAVTDHYATPPRVRPVKCPTNSGQSASTMTPLSMQQQPQPRNSRSTTCALNDYIPRTPNVEFGNGRMITPVSAMSEPTSATCLHCNTMRRTTGVHQTTQTTGPISPVPNQTMPNAILDSNLCQKGTNSALSTPSMSNAQMSPISPQLDQQIQQQLNCVQQPTQQPRNMQQQQQQQHYLQSAMHQRSSQPANMGNRHHHVVAANNGGNAGGNNLLTSTPQRSTLNSRQQMQQRFTGKQKLKEYVRKEIARYFGVDGPTEEEERVKWEERQKRLALRRFGPLKTEMELNVTNGRNRHLMMQQQASDRPDVLPVHTNDSQISHMDHEHHIRVPIEKKSSVAKMFVAGLSYVIHTLNKRHNRCQKQWSRSFAPAHVTAINGENPGDICEGLTTLQEDEVFFDSVGNDLGCGANYFRNSSPKMADNPRQMYMGERVHGWRTSAAIDQQNLQQQPSGTDGTGPVGNNLNGRIQQIGYRGTRISSQILDGVLENSRRPIARSVKLFHMHELDDRNDHRPFFTYWINTVQILVLTLSLICYGIGPIGFGIEQKTGQVLVTSLSLQTVQHQEQRNVWIGPTSNDLVHLGAKFAACMRRDIKIMDVISKTRRQERETACCIRNDDSGCVQSSQADCSVRGLWPTVSKSISTWKKWSPGESGPGGRISGSVCGLDPKYCDAPASIAPFEWPDDITKWPICRKTNSFSHRFRFKDHTAEHMVCEVIGHPCCTGVFGECRITTREYCDFVNGYFHEEASLCSQISCLNNVCGMFPFLSVEIPDQFYRLFTSLCLHAGILHLAITIAFQHILLADLERLMGPIRTAILYIGSGLAGNLTSAILVPYKPEVGPLSSLAGVLSSLAVLLILMHWKQLRKPHVALFKLVIMAGLLFGIGTLPWQQNFVGLLAGIFCGIFLTIALVPFVSVAKYGRKAKINLIWTCIIFHIFIYAIMFVIFYIVPTEVTSLNFGDVFSGGFNSNGIDSLGNHHIHTTTHHRPQQHHYHHSDDIMSNRGLNDDIDDGGGGTVSEISSNGNIITFNSAYGGRQQLLSARVQTMLLDPKDHQKHHRSFAAGASSYNEQLVVKCLNGVCSESQLADKDAAAAIDQSHDKAMAIGGTYTVKLRSQSEDPKQMSVSTANKQHAVAA